MKHCFTQMAPLLKFLLIWHKVPFRHTCETKKGTYMYREIKHTNVMNHRIPVGLQPHIFMNANFFYAKQFQNMISDAATQMPLSMIFLIERDGCTQAR